jgi:hypothetical protein
MAHRPVGVGSSFSVTAGAASTSAAFQVYSDTLRIVSTSNAFVKIEGEPTASSSDYYVTSVKDYTLALTPASSRITGIITGTTTAIDFPQGTGSPFEVGDYVSLTVSDQSYYNFTHKLVSSVLTSTSAVNGYFSRRIIVENNSAGIVTAFNSNNGDLRKSVKVSAFGVTSGAIYHQQVQISGDA